MSRNAKVGAGLLAALLVALLAVIVIQLTSEDDGPTASTATATATTPTAPEPEPNPEPEPTPEPTPTATTPTEPTPPADTTGPPDDEPVVTTDTPESATDETEAASAFARNELGIDDTGQISVTRSSADPQWALATFFAGNDALAVWLRREGEGERWTGVASSRNGQPAPEGQGIPSDLRFPFSEP